MYCRHLTLTNFRNYVHLDLALSPRLSVFWGENGQGKSNLLEALYVLATTRSYRTAAERELVNWHVENQPPFARTAAEIVRQPSPMKLELILAEGSGAGAGGAPGVAGGGAGEAVGAEAGADVHPGEAGQAPLASVRRRVRINGQPKRPLELLGHLNVVLFSPEDVELIGGPAALRRRYLDITLCQVDRLYLHALSRYQRVLQQRNALLKEARERTVRQDQFDYWDTQLAELGGSIVAARLRAVGQWNASLAAIYPRLVNDGAGLRAAYRSSIPLGDEAPALEGQEPARAAARLRERFVEQLAAGRVRERQQAVTLVGPHRDDIGFFAGEVDLRTYGSRGQQRVAALSLKLAEVEVMQQYTTERPVLLLDDVLSELDPRRRRYLQGVVRERPDQQVLMTATELTSFADDFLQDTEIHHVAAGKITRARE